MDPCCQGSERRTTDNFKSQKIKVKNQRKEEKTQHKSDQNSNVLTTTVHMEESSLVCLYLNARSLMNKISEFHATVYSLQPDVIGITESWATENVLDSELELTGYALFRYDRPVKKTGRWCITLYQNNMATCCVSAQD
jgi:hypothetical protein